MTEENYTYILECADGTLYCGWTNHLQERVAAHNAGKGARYTKNFSAASIRVPSCFCTVVLKYYETFSTKQEAMRREWAVKQLSRKEKLELIEAFTQRMRTS